MFKVQNLAMSFVEQELFTDVNFIINDGDRIGLIGRNGTGKTTLFNILAGKIKPEWGNIVVSKDYRIGYVEQHLKFTEKTVLEEGCLGLKEEEKFDSWKVEKILSGLGFTQEDMLLDPRQFSGGYQVKLNLAKILVSEPNLLLLDEPTNYLDISSIRWLARFLKNWPNELLIITHDQHFMDSVTTHTMIIHRKNVKKIEGSTGKLYEQIAVEEEIYEQSRINESKKRQEVEKFVNRFRAKASKAKAVQSRIKMLDKKEVKEKLKDISSLDFAFNYAPLDAKTLMEAEDLAFGYEGGNNLFSDLSFRIENGDRICVIGKNGRGKSTLLRILNGELKPKGGKIKQHFKTAIGYFGQTNIERLNHNNTIEGELMAIDPSFSRGMVRKVCGAMMFTKSLAEKSISVLSGGEKSRVLLGKILLTPANLLLLDEPTNHLDMDSCDSLIDAVEAFDGAAVIVTHNESFLHGLANKLIIFDGGKATLFEGTYQEFLNEIGWSNEDKPSKDKSASNTVSKKNINRKDLRKMRTQILEEQRKALKPISDKVKIAEDKITRLENELQESSSQISEGTGNIGELVARNGKLDAEIAKCYENLEDLLNEKDVQSAPFNERLEELES